MARKAKPKSKHRLRIVAPPQPVLSPADERAVEELEAGIADLLGTLAEQRAVENIALINAYVASLP